MLLGSLKRPLCRSRAASLAMAGQHLGSLIVPHITAHI
jgi:hypothetical protein